MSCCTAGQKPEGGSIRVHRVDLRVEDDVQHDYAALLHEVVDAVIVGEDAPDVLGNGVEFGFARIGRHGIGTEAPNAGNHFVLGPFRPDQGSALELTDDPFDGGGGPVGQNHVALHGRNFVRRGQTGG